MCEFCNVWVCVYTVYGFCNMWVFVCMGFCNVCVCVCVGFVMCGCFDNCVGVLVICILVFTAFCVVCNVFCTVSFPIIYSNLFCLD
jgi:hypothetical protein